MDSKQNEIQNEIILSNINELTTEDLFLLSKYNSCINSIKIGNDYTIYINTVKEKIEIQNNTDTTIIEESLNNLPRRQGIDGRLSIFLKKIHNKIEEIEKQKKQIVAQDQPKETNKSIQNQQIQQIEKPKR